jgi:uncharacterized protein
MSSNDSLFASLDYRHSIYGLKPESTISNDRLSEIITRTLHSVPSAFNTQSTRIITLVGSHHIKLWDIVKSHILPHVEGHPEKYNATNGKLSAFQNDSYATILFLEDPHSYDHLLSMKTYAGKYPSWRDQTSGMHQLVIWIALEQEGMGANIQRKSQLPLLTSFEICESWLMCRCWTDYNPVIDDDVKKEWKLPADWDLIAQMVIGKPASSDRSGLEKEKKPIKELFQMHS